MRILIVEDDLASRRFMEKYLSRYGSCETATNGLEAVDMVLQAMEDNNPYRLICLDIMMPKLDGMKTLKIIRNIEKERGIFGEQKAKIIMTTALNDKKTVTESYDSGCEAYAWKPIDTEKFSGILEELGFHNSQ